MYFDIFPRRLENPSVIELTVRKRSEKHRTRRHERFSTDARLFCITFRVVIFSETFAGGDSTANRKQIDPAARRRAVHRYTPVRGVHYRFAVRRTAIHTCTCTTHKRRPLVRNKRLREHVGIRRTGQRQRPRGGVPSVQPVLDADGECPAAVSRSADGAKSRRAGCGRNAIRRTAGKAGPARNATNGNAVGTCAARGKKSGKPSRPVVRVLTIRDLGRRRDRNTAGGRRSGGDPRRRRRGENDTGRSHVTLCNIMRTCENPYHCRGRVENVRRRAHVELVDRGRLTRHFDDDDDDDEGCCGGGGCGPRKESPRPIGSRPVGSLGSTPSHRRGGGGGGARGDEGTSAGAGEADDGAPRGREAKLERCRRCGRGSYAKTRLEAALETAEDGRPGTTSARACAATTPTRTRDDGAAGGGPTVATESSTGVALYAGRGDRRRRRRVTQDVVRARARVVKNGGKRSQDTRGHQRETDESRRTRVTALRPR